MIILKILLFIILAVLGIIILVLLMPVSASLSFIDGKFEYKAKYSFLNVIDSDGGGIVGRLLSKPKSGKNEKTDGNTENVSAGTTPSDSTGGQVETEPHKASAAVIDENASSDAEGAPQTDSPQEETLTQTETDEANPEEQKKQKKSLDEILELISGIWQSAKRPLRKIFKGFHFSELYIDFLVADEDAYKCAINYGRICAVVYNAIAAMSRIFTVKLKTIDVECGFAQEKSRWDASVKIWFIPMTAVIAGIWFLITYIFRIYLPNKIKNKKSAKKQKTQPQGGM